MKKEENIEVLTGIGQWNRLRVNITEEPSDGGKGDQHQRTRRSNDQGVEDRWFLMRGPTEVPERSRPELGSSHGCETKGQRFKRIFAGFG
jgi:hypothetical protein